MAALSSCPSVIVVAWLVLKHIARRAGGIAVGHGEELGIAAGRQEAGVELHMGIGEGG